MWEMGSISFDRLDKWSDIDVILIVDDDRVEETFDLVERILEEWTGIDLKFRIPEPTFHGHSQTFYRLKNASPYLLLDMAIIKENTENDMFLQYDIHGIPTIHFDKKGVVKDEGIDIDEQMKKIEARLEMLKGLFDMFQILTTKELHRKTLMDAYHFYAGQTIRPLVEVLRIKHCPQRFQFHVRYSKYDLPPEIDQRLEKFVLVANADDLAKRNEEAVKWFWEVFDSIDLAEVRKTLEAGDVGNPLRAQ